MADDPNADLIGHRFQGDKGELVVIGSARWNHQYVVCEKNNGDLTVRVAAQVRVNMRAS